MSITPRRLADIALAAPLLFALACVVWQFLRPDLDWTWATMSLYLLGPLGGGLRAAYFVLCAGLLALGAGYYLALPRPARSAAPLVLFVLGALALAVTAVADSNLPGGAPTLEGFVHGAAASTAFLCVTTAMLLQSWRLRGAAAFRARFGLALGLALACFAGLWAHALWRDIPRGLGQKIEIALIVCWLTLAASWLRAVTRSVAMVPSPQA